MAWCCVVSLRTHADLWFRSQQFVDKVKWPACFTALFKEITKFALSGRSRTSKHWDKCKGLCSSSYSKSEDLNWDLLAAELSCSTRVIFLPGGLGTPREHDVGVYSAGLLAQTCPREIFWDSAGRKLDPLGWPSSDFVIDLGLGKCFTFLTHHYSEHSFLSAFALHCDRR